MPYIYNNFLKPLTPSDRLIQILDSDGVVKYILNPFSILNTQVNNNIVRLSLKNDKIIILDFFSSDEAKSAIVSLQQQIDTLTQKTPLRIEKETENFVENITTLTPDGENLYIKGHLLPSTSSTYNIGSPTYEWHTLYVGSQSLVVGGVTISSSNGSIMMSGINLGTEQEPLLLSASGNSLYLNNVETEVTISDFATASTNGASSTTLFTFTNPIVDDVIWVDGKIKSKSLDTNNYGYIADVSFGLRNIGTTSIALVGTTYSVKTSYDFLSAPGLSITTSGLTCSVNITGLPGYTMSWSGNFTKG